MLCGLLLEGAAVDGRTGLCCVGCRVEVTPDVGGSSRAEQPLGSPA